MSSDTLATPRTAVPVERAGLRGFLTRHPVLVDVTIAAVYVLLMLPGLAHGLIFSVGTSAVHAGIGLAATIGAGVALSFRRRAPILVFAIVLVLVLVVKTLVLGLTDPLGLAVAGYALGAYLPQRRAWIAVVAAIIIVTVVVVVGVPLSSEALPVDALLILTLVLLVPACLLGLLVNMLSKLREAEELRVIHEMQEQVQAAELSAVQQRAMLSREMHDVVGHSLTAIINLSDGALRASTASPEVLEAGLRRINSIARDALGETRTILGTLRPEGEVAPRTPARSIEAPAPTGPASMSGKDDAELGIRELLDTAESTGLVTRLSVNGEAAVGFLTEEVRGAGYRIVQEAITNAMRHAKDVSLLTVSLIYTPENLTIQVRDDGHGPTEAATGNGLRGAAERAAELGGELHAGPAPAGGWHVTATIPVPKESTP
ncbi:sensor histidine kinase [Microbacterium sp.]|uniref:sensor histidine kinase n=1 Tax=Microbacterium sp. TaxID=51671 RepID=UPI0039E6AF15